PGTRINLARALLATESPAQTLAAAEAAVALAPEAAEPHFLRGTAHNALGQPERAEQALARAVALDPGHAPAWLNRGNACADLERLEEAERHCRTALRLDPGLVEAHASLGFVLTSQGRLAEARAACAEAIRLAPDFAQAHWNLATAALLAGDFETGFREYEWRKRHDRFRRDFIDLPRPTWSGEKVSSRTVLVQAEQGLGDAIQFSRYLPLMEARGVRVILACHRALIPLLRATPGLESAVDKAGPLPAYDAWIDQMDLPRIFATDPDTIPFSEGWLAADPARVAGWNASLPPGPRVGLVWAGNPAHSNDRRRSLPDAALAGLAPEERIRFVSLQVGPRAEAAAAHGILDVSGALTDYAETAAAIAALDLLVTVDTSVAHVAGALGKPAWVMLPFAPDWRWMLGRDNTPWYSSLRLFRQPEPGALGVVVARVAGELATWRQNNRPSPCLRNGPEISVGA
ncbi:MAG: tetratricopeptide repeat protein, partial [Pseudomonadota bacterium]|nr:tetratricopeptide repeat protein [Pseudomonadota bacterium]